MRRRRIAAMALFALGAACGAEMAASDRGGNIPNGGNPTGFGTDAGNIACTTIAQCPTAWTCQAGFCVPPEQPTQLSLNNAPPVATPHYVYALNPVAASVARIDPATLQIEAIPVGAQPVALSALAKQDAAVVLSQGDWSLSLIDSAVLPSKVTRVPLPRQYAMLTVSPDGAFAVAWPDPLVTPPSGAEGVFTLVDLRAVASGGASSQSQVELAGGYRLTDVIFRSDATGAAVRLFVFAQATVSSFDLSAPASTAPLRVTLPTSMSQDVASRAVVSSPDGQVVLLRSMTAPELASFDGTSVTSVPLPDIATDLALSPDDAAAVVALRASSTVAYLRIPQDLQNPAGMQTVLVDGGSVGRIALPATVPDAGLFAFVYSNVTPDKSFSRVDLPAGTVTTYALEKLIEEITLSPDAQSSIIIHRADPNTSSTDPYQAAVDRAQGYSVLDVASGFWELQLTGTVQPTRYAYSPAGGYAGVALRDDANQVFQLDAVNLTTLVSDTLSLPSTPLFMGTVPQAPGLSPDRVFVSQDFPAGRISVIALDTEQIRTVTGFTLNGEIQ